MSFARGYPREALEYDADAVLAVASEAPPIDAPTVVVDPRASATADVVIVPAADGIEVPGTVHRMDGVPLNMNGDSPRSSSRPSVEEVLAMIEARC